MSLFEQRYGGIARLYGEAPTRFLRRANVCVVGIGGVGSWVAEGLIRSAIGKITLIDMDDICVTNTNRQIHTTVTTVGASKVTAMANRLRDINPECEVEEVLDFVTAKNVAEHIDQRFDYVVDATDSINAKAAMIAHCKRNKIPVLTVGGAGGQIDPTQITVGDLAKTIQDPLASKLRSVLRRDYGFSTNAKRKFGVDCVYSTEQLRYPQGDGTVSTQKRLVDGSVKLDCNNGFGAAVTVTASFGFVAASRVIGKLLERAERQDKLA